MNLRRYSLVYIATVLGLMVVTYLFEKRFGHTVNYGALMPIAPNFAASNEARRYVRREGHCPETTEIRRFSLFASLVALGVTVVVVVWLILISPKMGSLMANPDGVGLVVGGIFMQAGVALLLTRWHLGNGAKSELAALKKRAAK